MADLLAYFAEFLPRSLEGKKTYLLSIFGTLAVLVAWRMGALPAGDVAPLLCLTLGLGTLKHGDVRTDARLAKTAERVASAVDEIQTHVTQAKGELRQSIQAHAADLRERIAAGPAGGGQAGRAPTIHRGSPD